MLALSALVKHNYSMSPRTQLSRIADELSAIATDPAPINETRITLLSVLSDQLETLITDLQEDAIVRAYREAA